MSRAPVVFEHLVSVTANGLTPFNRQRGFIIVEIKNASNSSYSQSSDKITIIPTHVYGQFGGFTHAHERATHSSPLLSRMETRVPECAAATIS